MSAINIKGVKDGRYQVSFEFCGYELRKYVIRFCGDFITSCDSRKAAIKAAIRHNKERMSAYR